MPMSPFCAVIIQVVDCVLLCCDSQTTVADCHCWYAIGTLCVDCKVVITVDQVASTNVAPIEYVMPLSDAPDIAMFRVVA